MQEKESADILPGDHDMQATSEATLEVSQGRPELQAGGQPQMHPRILLVEDDSSLASLEAEVLTAHGYMVAIAGEAGAAVAALQESPPDLVVLDLQLQNAASGWDVLQALRERAMIPVLLTSAESAIRAHMRSSGESRATLDHLPKPYSMQTLLKRIHRMLYRGREC